MIDIVSGRVVASSNIKIAFDKIDSVLLEDYSQQPAPKKYRNSGKEIKIIHSPKQLQKTERFEKKSLPPPPVCVSKTHQSMSEMIVITVQFWRNM